MAQRAPAIRATASRATASRVRFPGIVRRTSLASRPCDVPHSNHARSTTSAESTSTPSRSKITAETSNVIAATCNGEARPSRCDLWRVERPFRGGDVCAGAGTPRCGAQSNSDCRDRRNGQRRGTALRADAALRPAVETPRDLVAHGNLVISIVPPGQARQAAETVAAALREMPQALTYVDANAVAPSTVCDIEAIMRSAGATFLDAGIIEGPPRPGEPGPILFVSGAEPAPILALRDYTFAGEFEAAADALDRALTVFEHSGDAYRVARCRKTKADLLRLRGDTSAARGFG